MALEVHFGVPQFFFIFMTMYLTIIIFFLLLNLCVVYQRCSRHDDEQDV